MRARLRALARRLQDNWGSLHLMSSEFQVNMGSDATSIVDALLLAERRTALVTRCRPLNMQTESERLLADWSAGCTTEPHFRYAPRADLSASRTHLESLKRALVGSPWGDFYAGRIDELILETRVADAVGTDEIVELSRRRYQTPFEPSAASALVAKWLVRPPAVESELVISDDLGDERSLLRCVQRWVGRERLPFRVEVSADLVSLAATGEGFIVVAAGRKLSPEDAERVAVHEVLGHARPRAAARRQSVGLFVAGSEGGNDTQEGYAVYCEQHAGLLHAARRFELGLRHLACTSVWQGSGFAATVQRLVGYGAALDLALRVSLRAYRGGGLAREGAYLPAYCAVSGAIAEDSALLDWLAAGRLSLPAISRLRAAGYRLAQR
jgi:hypothetical protein